VIEKISVRCPLTLTLSPQSLGEREREEIFFAKAEFIADAAARRFSGAGFFLLMPLLS
jgi:hypothetical protein